MATINTLEQALSKTASEFNTDLAKKKNSSNTTESQLMTYFTAAKAGITKISNSYKNVVSMKRKIAEAFVVSTIYQTYGVLFGSRLDQFQKLTILANALMSQDSDLNRYVNLITTELGLYYSETTDSAKQVHRNKITTYLNDLKAYLQDLLSQLPFVPQDIEVDKTVTNSDGTHPIKSKNNRAFHSDGEPSVDYDLFKASINRQDIIGQNTTAYIKIKSSENVENAEAGKATAYVSLPLHSLLNQEFTVSYYRFLIFWLFPHYLGDKQIENDGSDANEKGEYVTNTSEIRLGKVFKQTSQFSKTDPTLFKYKYNTKKDVNWTTGECKYISTYRDQGINITCGFNEGQTGVYEKQFHMSDTVIVSATSVSSNSTYAVSGTLDYDKTRSEAAKNSIYTGSLTLKLGDQSTSRPVLLTIHQASDQSDTYDISIQLDPDSSVNTSADITDNPLDVSCMAPIMLSRTYTGVSLTQTIDTDNDNRLKTVQVLTNLSDLDVGTTDADFSSFSDSCHKLTLLLASCKTMMSDLANQALLLMDQACKSATTAMSVVKGNDSSYDADSDYASDVQTKFISLQSSITKYTTTTSGTDNTTAIFDGTAYQKISAAISDFEDQMSQTVTDLTDSMDRISNVEQRLSMLSDVQKTDTDFYSSLVILYNIFSGESQTISAFQQSGQSYFDKIAFDDFYYWRQAFYTDVTEQASLQSSVVEYLYLFSQVKKYNQQYPDFSKNTSAAWLKAYNYEIAKLMNDYGYRNGNPFGFKDGTGDDMISVQELKQDKADVELYSGFQFNQAPNEFKINPFIYQSVPGFKKFNDIDIQEMLIDVPTKYDDYFAIWKQIVYSALLGLSSDSFADSLKIAADGFSSRPLNIRETILKHVFDLVLPELKDILGDAYAIPTVQDDEEALSIIKKYGYVMRIYVNLSSDTAITYMKPGTSLRRLLVEGYSQAVSTASVSISGRFTSLQLNGETTLTIRYSGFKSIPDLTITSDKPEMATLTVLGTSTTSSNMSVTVNSQKAVKVLSSEGIVQLKVTGGETASTVSITVVAKDGSTQTQDTAVVSIGGGAA